MRRFAPLILACSLVAGASVLSVTGAAAQTAPPAGADLPTGFTDGVPVGSGDAAPTTKAAPDDATARTDTKANATAPTKYFGDGPWAAIQAAADATPRCTGLSGPGLTALVVSPIFKESSAASRPSSAPSPMTLSRYDEWNGVYATTNNVSANYGLYAFRNPNTTYVRAYWHPGIGIWQYDSAGVGAPYTGEEAMDVRIVGADVAKGMANRYCNPPTSVVGHSAPFSDQERRDAAWWPWWAGTTSRSCRLCQVEFDRMTSSTPYFRNISLVPGISATGGAVQRSCTVPGQASSVTCWYVNPAVGVIQGSTAWATLSPDGNGSPTRAPAPLSKPFYVVERNGTEERYWLKADTGYDTDISAVRQMGKNARPRSSQSGSGLAWAKTGLCDLTAHRGACGTNNTTPPPTNPPPTTPPPAASGSPIAAPPGMNSTRQNVSGNFRSIPLDVNGDKKGDVLWYAPGTAGDVLWLGNGSGSFTSKQLTVDGRFDDVLALDANNDKRDDILWYTRSTGAAVLWTSNGNGTFTSSRLTPGAGKRPSVGDFDGNGTDDIFWYGPGTAADSISSWSSSGWHSTARSVSGNYAAIVGDFDGNHRDDIFWYAPGSTANNVWLNSASGGYVSKTVKVGGAYWPLVGDFDGDKRDDIVWYLPGASQDSIWFGGANGAFSVQTFKVNVTYQPIVADLGNDGRDDLVWYAPGNTGDLWTRWADNRGRNSVGLKVGGDHRPIVGAFSTGGGDGILWYAAGSTPDALWWR